MLLTTLLLTAAAAVQPAADRDRGEVVRCSDQDRPAQPCRLKIVTRAGVRHLVFQLGDGRRVTFVGRAQSGWWSGKLDGRPAMGFERNRGYVVFSTIDLSRTFAWFYPGQDHGTY